jgi:hypothetical protein
MALNITHGELVYTCGGVEVVWVERYSVYEVWAPIANGPDDFSMEMIADCPDEADAIFYADEFIGVGH